MRPTESKLSAFLTKLTGIKVRKIPRTRSECATNGDSVPDATLSPDRVELMKRIQTEMAWSRAVSIQPVKSAKDLRARADWSQVDRFLGMGKQDEHICEELEIPPADLALRKKMNQLRGLTSLEAGNLIRNLG